MKEVNIEITHDCALKCIFCSSSADHPSPSESISASTVRSVLLSAKKCNADTLSISGGEPFLHPQFFDILNVASRLGYKILLYTSGVIFDSDENRISISIDIWKQVRRITSGNIVVIFDLIGSTPSLVDRLSGVSGVLPLLIDSVSNAKACDFDCEAHVVPMAPNFTDLFSIVDFAKKLGLSRLSFLRFVPQGRGSINAQELLLSPPQFLELQYVLLRLLYNSQEGKEKIRIRLGHPIDFTFLIDPKRQITFCRGGKDSPCILPNGDVFMCPAWKNLKALKAGNIHEHSLEYIWKDSDMFTHFAELLKNPHQITGKCFDCVYISQCKAGCVAQRILRKDNTMEFPMNMYCHPEPCCPLVLKVVRHV